MKAFYQRGACACSCANFYLLVSILSAWNILVPTNASVRSPFQEQQVGKDERAGGVDKTFQIQNALQQSTEDRTRRSRGVELFFEGIGMTIEQRHGKNKRVILDGSVCGKASPGRMLAIIGGSGAGKTSLLHALAGSVQQSTKVEISGMRYINGNPVLGDALVPSAFIPQEVDFFPHMTVAETLDFRIELMLGDTIDLSTRRRLVNNILERYALNDVADTIIGNSKIRGISGGERKRLTIACEMIGSAQLIFLDEPTSGLDSYQASEVIKTLRKLADGGKTIVAVLHQPNQQLLSMFDDLLLLSEGKLMYFGEVSKVREYFESLGYGCPIEVGTAEHILSCVSRSNSGDQARKDSEVRINRLSGNALKCTSSAFPETSAEKGPCAIQAKHASLPEPLLQYKRLLGRSLQEVFRGRNVIKIKAIQQFAMGAIYGSIYKLGNNQASIMDRVGLISLILCGTTSMAMTQTARAFPRERAIVAREMESKLYGTAPYVVSKAVSEIPLILLLNFIFCSVVHPLTGLQKQTFRNFFALTSLHAITSEAVGLLIASFSPSSDVALAVMPAIFVLNIIFDGKNISAENTPMLLRWIPKIGLLRWGFESLMLTEFPGLKFETKGPMMGPPLKSGLQVLARFGLTDHTVQNAVEAQVIITGVCWMMCYLGLAMLRPRYETMKAVCTS